MSIRFLSSFYKKLRTPYESLSVTFIGMPGAGKSHWARALGQSYGKPVLELDEQIEQHARIPLLTLTQQGREGERLLTHLENKVMHDVMKQHMYKPNRGVFVSPGGSCVYARCAEEFFAHPRNLVVFLNAPFELLEKRTKGFTNRGIVFHNQTPTQLKKERDMLYRRYADICFDVTANQNREMGLLDNILTQLYGR